MSDYFPGQLTIYVPKGGIQSVCSPQECDQLRTLLKPVDSEGMAKILGSGGTLVIGEDQGTFGNVLGVPHEEPLPAGLDFDHHSDARYEFDATWTLQRAGVVTSFASDNNYGILLGHEELRKMQKAGKRLADAVALTARLPKPSYRVPRRRLELDVE